MFKNSCLKKKKVNIRFQYGGGEDKSVDVQKDSIISTDRRKYPASRNRLLSFGTRLNKLLDTVASMEGQIQKQEDSGRIFHPSHLKLQYDPMSGKDPKVKLLTL